MLPVITTWLHTLTYFLFGFCLNGQCTGTMRTSMDTQCGKIFLTVSSLRKSSLEMNWQQHCELGDNAPHTIALYNKDIRNGTEDSILYAEISTADHPTGYFRTRKRFNLGDWPESWAYNSTTLSESGPQSLPYWIVSFSKSGRIADVQSLKLQPTWMHDNRESLKHQQIGNLLIPGTHDSGCYGDINLIEDYVLTQDMPIWHQLVFGIRYLDLRIAFHQDNEFWINHDIVRVKRLNIIYDQIKTFIHRSPGEIIIVDFHRFPFPNKWSDNLHEKFIHYTLKHLGEFIYSKNGTEDFKGPTLEQIWNTKKNIILTYGEKRFTEKYKELWDPIPQFWANTIEVDTLKEYLSESLNHHNSTMFNALMAELTPRFIDVFTGENTLRELANDVNRKITKWVRDEWKQKVNIITTDFFLGNNLIDVALEINRNR